MDCFINDLELDPATGQELCSLCAKHGILQAVDFAALRPAQMRAVLQGASDGTTAKADFVLASAKKLSLGWAAGSLQRAERTVATEGLPRSYPPVPLYMRPVLE